jgi:ribosome maturation factor RimP
MLTKDTQDLIQENAKQVLDPLGFELVELKIIRSNNELILRFLIDRVEGGITLNECAQLNRDISQLLDEKNIIGQEYNLEVSSPGLDRPLQEGKDFRRVLEKIIHVFLKEKQEEKLEFEGRLVRLEKEGIVINADQQEELFIPFTKINKAKQVIK